MEYVKLPDVIDAVQLTGLSECGCTPSFNEPMPNWLQSLIAARQLRGLPGRPDGGDPLSTLPRFGLADHPDRSITVGGWIIRKRVRGSICGFDTMSDTRFREEYGPKLAAERLAGEVTALHNEALGKRSDVVQIGLDDLERAIFWLDVPHISQLSQQFFIEAVLTLKIARDAHFFNQRARDSKP